MIKPAFFIRKKKVLGFHLPGIFFVNQPHELLVLFLQLGFRRRVFMIKNSFHQIFNPLMNLMHRSPEKKTGDRQQTEDSGKERKRRNKNRPKRQKK